METCCLVWAFCTTSRPTLIRGVRMARVKSVTLMPCRWHTFWAAEEHIQSGEGAAPQRKEVLELTGVVGHGGLLAVPLLLKLDVAQLENRGDHFQHTWKQEEESEEEERCRRSAGLHVPILSSSLKPMISMASRVSSNSSSSSWPGISTWPATRKR